MHKLIFSFSVVRLTYINDKWASGEWGELKDSPRVIVFYNDNLSASEASFQDLIFDITPGTHTHKIKHVQVTITKILISLAKCFKCTPNKQTQPRLLHAYKH